MTSAVFPCPASDALVLNGTVGMTAAREPETQESACVEDAVEVMPMVLVDALCVCRCLDGRV